MAKRRDNRGIVLEKGESQDSTGRYRYRYYDDKQISHDVYSWRLRPEDDLPEGKKPCESLREIEIRIQKELQDNIKAWGANVTVNKLIEEYISQQTPYWEPSTCNSANNAYHVHIKNKIGKRKIRKVTADIIECFYSDVLNNKDRPVQIGSIAVIDKVLNGAFKLAVKRNLIRNNPVEGCYGSIKRKNNVTEKVKHSLEEEQQHKLLEFIRGTPKYSVYYPFFYLLAWTGCRIGELLGLTWYDLDFSQEIIRIDHKITYTKVNGHYQFIIGEPKTENGVREIPMLGEVKEILLRMRIDAGWSKIVPVKKPKISIQDTSPFIFVNGNSNLIPQVTMEHLLKRIIRDYNKQAEIPIQDITPHTFRHSFCCWLCENVQGENSMDDIKYIQSIMGHTDASTTLNIYSELRKNNAKSKHEALKKKAMKM